MKNKAAVALGSIKSERKKSSSRENGKLGGRPRKPMEIPITQGKVALVDREDYKELSKHKWSAHKRGVRGGGWYAIRKATDEDGRKYKIWMHRFVLKTPNGTMVDHIDGDGLNNTKANLRVCTPSQNQINTGRRSTNTSGFKGVTFNKEAKKWKAQIRIKGKHVYLGYYDTPLAAYEAYCDACIKYHGEFARVI